MKMIRNGEFVDAANGATIDVYNPVTHELLDTVPAATPEDVDAILTVAQEGAKIWGRKTADERYAILAHAADVMMEHQEELAAMITKEVGKPIAQSRGCVDLASQLIKGYAEKAKYVYGQVLPNTEDLITVRHEPLGVVVCVMPFNFPIEMFGHKAGPALAAGNAVVVKPASDTPLATIMLTKILIDAGIPKEVLQVVTGGGGTVGRALANSPKVNAISLTGSTAVGIDIIEQSAKNMTRTFMELGGNDGVIIFEDTDIEHAVDEAIIGRIYNGGQVCCASKRFIVQETIADKFVKALSERLAGLKIGDPFDPATDMGSMISEKAACEIEKQVEATVAAGAKIVYGGHRYDKTFFEPTILTGVTRDMPVAIDMEIFGPVFPIITFKTEEEAISILNQSPYGLSSGVMTKDLNRAYRVASQLDAGTTAVNGVGMYRTIHMPHGGHKMSGMGTEGYLETLEEMMCTHTISFRGLMLPDTKY